VNAQLARPMEKRQAIITARYIRLKAFPSLTVVTEKDNEFVAENKMLKFCTTLVVGTHGWCDSQHGPFTILAAYTNLLIEQFSGEGCSGAL